MRRPPTFTSQAARARRRTARAARWSGPRRPAPPGPGSRPRADRTTRDRAPTAGPRCRPAAAASDSMLLLPARNSTSFSNVASDVGSSATRSPSRMHTTRSVIFRTSRRRWEMYTIAMPSRSGRRADRTAGPRRTRSASRWARRAAAPWRAATAPARSRRAASGPGDSDAQRGVRIDVAPHPLAAPCWPAVERGAIDRCPHLRRLVPEHDVRAHVQVARTGSAPAGPATPPGESPRPGSAGLCPSMDTVPASGRWTPAATFIKVDLPAPLPPRSPTISPGFTSKSTPRNARTPPNDFSTRRNERLISCCLSVSARSAG